MTGATDLADVDGIALLSDGAARLVEFGLADWEEVLRTLRQGGPEDLFATVRRAEHSDSQGTRWPRYKMSDDATAVYLEPEPE